VNKHTQPVSLSKGFSAKNRIETQIHRRRTIKIFSPLLIEWDGGAQPIRTEPSQIDPDIKQDTASEES